MITSLVFFPKAIFVSSGEKASAVGRKEDVRYQRFVRHEDSQKVKALRSLDLHADT